MAAQQPAVGNAAKQISTELDAPAPTTRLPMEPAPTTGVLDRLNHTESTLYSDLISNTYAPPVRLEQERVGFSIVEKATSGA